MTGEVTRADLDAVWEVVNTLRNEVNAMQVAHADATGEFKLVKQKQDIMSDSLRDHRKESKTRDLENKETLTLITQKLEAIALDDAAEKGKSEGKKDQTAKIVGWVVGAPSVVGGLIYIGNLLSKASGAG